MIKLLYLLVGILLKQTVDEFKVLIQHKISDLEKLRDEFAEYRPNPAVRAGSQEAYSAIARAQQREAAQPQINRISRQIRRYRVLPVIGYASLTLVLIGVIAWLEYTAPGSTDPSK